MAKTSYLIPECGEKMPIIKFHRKENMLNLLFIQFFQSMKTYETRQAFSINPGFHLLQYKKKSF